MRRMLSFGMATLALLAVATGSAPAGPTLLFDANTGQVLESEQPFARWYPASLTKLMTTYVAFRAVQAGEVTLQSPVRVSAQAINEPRIPVATPNRAGSEKTPAPTMPPTTMAVSVGNVIFWTAPPVVVVASSVLAMSAPPMSQTP